MHLFRNLKYSLLAAMLCLTTANAVTLAVLEITIASNDDEEIGLTVDETKFISDELRRQAIRILPKDYTVLSREKIISLIPETAENLNSVVDIGMVIKSDYVTRGYIGKVGNLLTLTVELYETASGSMIGDFVKEATDLKGFLEAIRENSPGLFSKIMSPTAASIPTNIPTESTKIKTSFWVAIGLDVLGATAIGLGVYKNSKAGDYHSKNEKLMEDVRPGTFNSMQKEFDDNEQKMKDAKMMRNIFYATGGALLLGGVAVHIWF